MIVLLIINSIRTKRESKDSYLFIVAVIKVAVYQMKTCKAVLYRLFTIRHNK